MDAICLSLRSCGVGREFNDHLLYRVADVESR
jgi:hypothetical protein